MKSLLFILPVLAAMALLAFLSPVRAEGALALTVTNCDNEIELRNKIVAVQNAQGGTLNFNCGTKTIQLSAQLPLIEYDTTIDGGNKITLNGQDNVRAFQVSADGALMLKNIVLDKGHANANMGGAIFNLGHLTLNNVTIQNSFGPLGGGAIYTNGKLDILNSTFTKNLASQGGAIYADSITSLMTITDSTFNENQTNSTNVGGAIYSTAAFRIANSQFIKNKAGSGGAIYARRAFLNTSGSITGSRFDSNESNSSGSDPSGGALYIENLTVQLAQIKMQKNLAQYGGAIHVAENGRVEIADSTLEGNQALGGGALSNYGEADVQSAVLLDNLAFAGAGIYNTGSLSVRNATFAGNGALLGAAFYQEIGSAFLTNVTMVSNISEGLDGSAIANRQGNQPHLALTNVLIDNPEGTVNCFFETAPTVSNNNLSSDNTCNFGAGRDNVELKLGPLDNNGGFTQTHLPQSGSPAIDNGTSVNAPATDQRGVTRPQGPGMDVGAVEVSAASPTATPTRTVTPPPTCTGKPAKPTLLKPRDAKKVNASGVKLDWNDTLCAQKYKVIIKKGNPTGTKFQQRGGLLNSEFVTNPLSSGESYAWRVVAINSADKTKSEWWMFTSK